MLNFKKPAFWIVAAVAVCIAIAVFFPARQKTPPVSFRAIQISWARTLDLRPNEPSGYDLSDEQLEALKSRLADLKIGRRDSDFGGFTPLYSLSVYSSQTGQFMLAGYDHDGKHTALVYQNTYYRITDEAFGEYLSGLCAGDSLENDRSASTLWGQIYKVEEIVYEASIYDFFYTKETAPGYCITNAKELLVFEDNAPNDYLKPGKFEKAWLTEENFDRCFRDGTFSADVLRKNNKEAWRLLVSDLPGSVFYYLLLQENGDVYLSHGYYNYPEENSSDAVGSSIQWLFKLSFDDTDPAGDSTYASIDTNLLREQYPEYFDLPTAKGLEVYVWQTSENSYSCGVVSGTNRGRTNDELRSLKGITVDEMKAILSTYDIPDEQIIIIPFHNPVSSFWSPLNKEYQARLNDLFFGE